MIIPIKCFTCGKVLADKHRFYVDTVEKSGQQKLYKFGDAMNKITTGYFGIWY